MSSKTKIVVLHMKEIIYTVIFAALALLLILLLVFMFLPNKNESENSKQKYIPGVYTSDVTLNNTALEVEVTVDESHINSIRFSNLDESVAAMYPLSSRPSRILRNRFMTVSHWKIFSIPLTVLTLLS